MLTLALCFLHEHIDVNCPEWTVQASVQQELTMSCSWDWYRGAKSIPLRILERKRFLGEVPEKFQQVKQYLVALRSENDEICIESIVFLTSIWNGVLSRFSRPNSRLPASTTFDSQQTIRETEGKKERSKPYSSSVRKANYSFFCSSLTRFRVCYQHQKGWTRYP